MEKESLEGFRKYVKTWLPSVNASYSPKEIPAEGNQRSALLQSLNGCFVLTRDEHQGEDYQRGRLMFDRDDSEIYWLITGGNKDNRKRFHVHDLTGLMVEKPKK